MSCKNLKILITGATGFVGKALTAELNKTCTVVIASRSIENVTIDLEHRKHDLLDPDRIPDMRDIDVVIHTAARVHVMDDNGKNQLAAFRASNVSGTAALANAAALAGVKRFIYLSSIKVNGESTTLGQPFTVADTPNPQDPYGISKMEAEQFLRELEIISGIEIVIIRPPLVYGPGAKGNFYTMMKWVNKGAPLPLGAIKNRRSLVSLKNLVDLLKSCSTHPAAAGSTFLVSDGEDISTPELLSELAMALGRPARLFPVPEHLVRSAANFLRKSALAERLCGSLQVEIEATRSILGWSPPYSMQDELQITAEAFLLESLGRKV